jgi:hypothetical protein
VKRRAARRPLFAKEILLPCRDGTKLNTSARSVRHKVAIPTSSDFLYCIAMTSARLFQSAFVCIMVELAFAPSRAVAELIAYEPFDYATSTKLAGANGGFGFASAWAAGGFNARAFQMFTIAPGGLTYPGLATEGDSHVRVEIPAGPAIAGLGRAWAKPLGREPGTFYLSFLHRPDGNEEYGSIVLGTGAGKELAVGKSAATGQYYISNRGGAGRALSGVPGEIGRTRLIVVKMEFQPGPDRFTLYVDPAAGKSEPANGVVKEDLDLPLVDKIFLYSRAAWSVDEIRLGTTWEDVTPAEAPAGKKALPVSAFPRWKVIIWIGIILLAMVVVAVPLVVVGFIAYRRGQQKARGESPTARE